MLGVVVLVALLARALPLAHMTSPEHLQVNDTLAVVVLVFFLGSLVMIYPPWRGRRQLDRWLVRGSLRHTATGLSTTVAIGDLDDASKLAMTGAMLVGGSVGSTAGGFKLLRLVVARTAAPRHAVVDVRLGGRRVDDADLWRAMLLMVTFALMVFYVVAGLPRPRLSGAGGLVRSGLRNRRRRAFIRH